MLAVICNTPLEQDELLKRMQNIQAGVVNNVFVHNGIFKDIELLTCLSGEGKVNAAMVATILITQLDVNRIIFIGKAKRIDSNVNDIVIASSVIQSDFKLDDNMTLCKTDSALNELIKSKYPKAGLGLIVTSDSDITYPYALCMDNESGAIGLVCQRLNIPFTIVKSLSDNKKELVDIVEKILG